MQCTVVPLLRWKDGVGAPRYAVIQLFVDQVLPFKAKKKINKLLADSLPAIVFAY